MLAEKAIRRGVFTPVDGLEEKNDEFIRLHNDGPKPFKWTKSASKILEKVERAKQVLFHGQV